MITDSIISSKHKDIFIYAVNPFHLIKQKVGDLFDPVDEEGLSISNYENQLKEFRNILESISYSRDKQRPGDFTKYYDFIKHHFGPADSPAYLEVFDIEPNKLIPNPELEGLKNWGAQFSSNTGRYYLGNGEMFIQEMSTIHMILNVHAGLGYLILGFSIAATDGSDVFQKLYTSDFFRNIGWKKGKPLKKNSSQYQKFTLYLQRPNQTEKEAAFTFFELFQIYLHPLRQYIRLYQDRFTLLYTSCSYVAGERNTEELKNMLYEIIRVPDRNASKFSHELSEPKILNPGKHILCTALNEGAFVIESVNESIDTKSIGNKYLPGFLLAINQREVLLKTMHRISLLNTGSLISMNEQSIQNIKKLKISLLVIQLKQIFYSISNTNEIEAFFTHLQQVFSIQTMLKENDQSIREMYNLLEENRKELEIKYREESAERDKIEADIEEYRSKIMNTILGAIGCLGLFSFLKDLLPFIIDTEFPLSYKFITIFLPVSIMTWLIWYMFRKRGKE